MAPTLMHRSVESFEKMSAQDLGSLLASVRALQIAAYSGKTQPLLRGKNLGLMCETDLHVDASLFRHAAAELGANVAHIRPGLSEFSPLQEVQRTARMLGRLYDAVECQGLAPTLVSQLGQDAGVPVFESITAPWHPTARLAEQLEGHATDSDKRRFILQAVLLCTIG